MMHRTRYRPELCEIPVSHALAFSRRFVPELCIDREPSQEQRAQGMPGDGLAHGPPANKKTQAAVTTGLAKSSGIPRAMVLTASFALSPGTGLSCPRHRRDHLSPT